MEEFFEKCLDDDFSCDPDEELIVTILGAAEHGDLESLKAVKGAEPLAFSRCLKYYGGRLIFEAIRWRQYEAADFLLCNGCSTGKQFSMKTTALHLAAKDHHATEFLERLLMYQDTKTRDVRNNTPLHVACLAGVTANVEILLQHGAECNVMNSSLQTPLHLAASGGHIDSMMLLLQSGALVNARDSEEPINTTPLDLAAQSLFAVLGNENLIRGVRSFVNWNSCRTDDILENLKSLNIFSNPHSTDSSVSGNTYNEILISQIKTKLQIIDVLIQHGARFNILILTAKYSPPGVFTKIMKELIENCQVDINARDHLNYTALHFVVLRFSNDETLEYFLKRGADVNAMSVTKVTPLEIALKERVADKNIKLLIESGANVNYSKDSGWSPLMYALINQKLLIAETLLEHGADPNVREPGPSGFTPLMRLLNRIPYYPEVIACLLRHGADITLQDNSPMGLTPLHMVAMCPSRGDKEGREVMRDMLRYVKNVNIKDNFNFSPLLRAVMVRYASIPIIRLLLEAGADPHLVGVSEDEAESPLDVAIKNQKNEVINILLEYETSFNPKHLFDKRNKLLNTIAMNKPYNRNELFAVRRFYHREDINIERMKTVEVFVRSRNHKRNQGYFNNLVCCLYELLQGSPVERSCLSKWTSGLAVLFSEVENYVLGIRRLKTLDESVLRGVLEYRLEVNDGDSYKDACTREIREMKFAKVCDEICVLDLLTKNIYELTGLMRKNSVFHAISHNLYKYTNELEFPIYSETIKRHVRDSVARRNLLHSASYFMNEFFAQRQINEAKRRKLVKENPHDLFSSLPQYVLDNILSYLSNADLINWIIFASETDPQGIYELKKLWKIQLEKVLTADTWKNDS
uniref:Ankyrin-1 n=1 Tax=Lygus hesperus TaxID=30085 RepID=A0A0A9XRY4_LYGHE